jgi:mannose-1-phosphate guanylyltransferase/phosphomannomutase
MVSSEFQAVKAMLLAAGEGTRLAPLTEHRPKPILPVLNQPHLAHTLFLLRQFDVELAIINLHYRPERIIEALGDGSRWGLSIAYSPEEQLLGTAGAVKRAAAHFDAPFCVLYGDNLFDIDLQALVRLHESRGAHCTLGLHRAPDPTAAGLVETDEEGRVLRFREKPPRDQVTTDWANGGVYVLDPLLLEQIPRETPIDFGHDLFPEWIAAGVRMYARPMEGLVQDIGTASGYLAAHRELMSGAAPRLAEGWRVGLHERAPGVWAAPTARIDPGAELLAPVVLGERCLVGAGARVGPFTVLGPETRIGEKAGVKRSVLWYGSVIESMAQVEETVVASGARIGAGAVLRGETLVGEGVYVAPNASPPPGARLRVENETP